MESRVQTLSAPDSSTIAYWTAGDAGPWVVVVPSLGRGGRDFDRLLSDLTAAGFRALAFDPRGIDESRCSPSHDTLHDPAADLALFIEQLGDAPVHVVGHAYGQRVARCLAADRPELVRTVTLLAAGGLVAPAPEALDALRRCFQLNLPQEERLESVQRGFFAPGNDPAVWIDGWWPAAAAAQSDANRATPLDDWWAAGRAPVLVVQGLDDVIAVPANGHALRDRLGDRVRVVDLQNAGHALLPEQPEAIAEAVVAFLSEES